MNTAVGKAEQPMKLAMPYHFGIYQREGTKWFTYDPTKVIFNGTDQPVHLQKIEQEFGLTEEQVTIALFRLNGGKAGLYLANLKEKQYYYCGSDWENIKTKLLQLGIGRADPLENKC